MRAGLLSLLVVAAGCGTLPGAFTRVPVPQDIAPAADQKLEMVVVGTGVQIYRCDRRPGQPDGYEWTFQSPEATLRDVAGKYLGKHYAGPTWEAADASKVVGTVEARRDASERGAIAWLRLSTRSTGVGGIFAGVTTIVRIGTSGGAAPATGCNERELGKILRVPYSADYNLYVKR
jgi:hypothetical protein